MSPVVSFLMSEAYHLTSQIFPLFIPEISASFMFHTVKFGLDPVTVVAQVASFHKKKIEHCPTMVNSASVYIFTRNCM